MGKYPVIDAHCDTVGLIARDHLGYDFRRRNRKGHIDLPRLKESGITLQFFALYIEEEHKPVGSLKRCLQLLDHYYRTMESCRDKIDTVFNTADLDHLAKSDKLAVLLSIEGGEALENSIEVLHILFRLGIRALGLTWNQQNQLATGVGKGSGGDGLTSFGRTVVREMNKLGMIVDLAHINEKGFYEAIETSCRPVIVSHANARSLCDHPRNLTDEQLKELARCGGVIGLSFYPAFITTGETTLGDLLDHFVHIADLIGTDHLGFGSDFDGINKVIPGLEDVTGLPRLIEGLQKRGFSREEIKKIAGINFLQILKKVLPPAKKEIAAPNKNRAEK
ncbi:MAG: dipeptidase [Bacillota bacterium]|nr:dipeptidase [Bacillota bacterium]